VKGGTAFVPDSRPGCSILILDSTGAVKYVTTPSFGDEVLYAKTVDEPYSGNAVIRVRGNIADMRGNQIHVGYNWGGGATASITSPFWVVGQQEVSYEGELLTEFQCLNAWEMMAFSTRMNVATYDTVKGAPGPAPAPGAGSPRTFNRVLTVFEALQQIIEDENGWLAHWLYNTISVVSDDGIINDYKPLILTEINDDDRMLIRRLLAMTKSVIYFRAGEGLQLRYLDPNMGSPDYIFGTGHPIFESRRETSTVIPNRVIFADDYPNVVEGTVAHFVGVAEHPDKDKIGPLAQVFADPSIVSDAEAQLRAEAILARIEAESLSGEIVVPLHATLELYDVVQVVDPRGGESWTSRVGRIENLYAAQRQGGNGSSQRYSFTSSIQCGGIGFTSYGSGTGAPPPVTIINIGPPAFITETGPAPLTPTEQLLEARDRNRQDLRQRRLLGWDK
jgi:hypothetical protein